MDYHGAAFFPLMADATPPAVLASHRNLWLVGTGLALAVVVALALFGPADTSPCLFLAATGVACPGCGMTRALAALLRGDWATMWRLHPLAAIVTIEGLLTWALWGWLVFVRRRRIDEAWMLWLLLANAGFLLVVWIVRLASGTLPG